MAVAASPEHDVPIGRRSQRPHPKLQAIALPPVAQRDGSTRLQAIESA